MGLISTSRRNTIISKYEKNILVLEPYYGGSHKRFLKELTLHLPYSFTFLTLPARKWKWRMRFAAPWFAEKLKEEEPFDAILCSSFVDVATFRSLAPSWVKQSPILTYFHENQFAYPVQVEDERDFHFSLTNFTTALASDGIAFNSAYNLETFLAGVKWMVKKAPDMKLGSIKELEERAVVIYPGLDFSNFQPPDQHTKEDNIPVLVWNHRWEHDKNPEKFFKTLYLLSDQKIEFKLIVMGESFQRCPSVFAQARERLADHIIHFGYLPKRSDYLQMLAQGSVVVSTAKHEFYGYSVIEAVRSGCRPLLPDRLSYPGLFPSRYLYQEDDFGERLLDAMQLGKLDRSTSCKLTDCFGWEKVAGEYRDWFVSSGLAG